MALVGVALVWALAALPFARPAACIAGFATYALVAVVVLARLPVDHPHRRFGAANAITLARAGGAALVMALAFEPAVLAGRAGWWAVAGAGLLLALDGLDGPLARAEGTASGFGARFDMETDALLILGLSALVFGLGKAGGWVLGLGALRYAFVLAGVFVPRLAGMLPPSARRRAVCGLQVAVLGLLLAPPLVPPVSSAFAAVALAALVASFAVDVAWLLRR